MSDFAGSHFTPCCFFAVKGGEYARFFASRGTRMRSMLDALRAQGWEVMLDGMSPSELAKMAPVGVPHCLTKRQIEAIDDNPAVTFADPRFIVCPTCCTYVVKAERCGMCEERLEAPW